MAFHFCPQCGTKLQPGFKFCPSCGEKLPCSEESDPIAASLSPSKSTETLTTNWSSVFEPKESAGMY
uniref:Zinc-ribbon domain-containing protein n=1 Tax=Neogobius melanostomus TaxID=47308 RepID=A0A8C6UD39_9GOBI